MTPDELDTAIRQELQFAARLAPDPGPVRRRVLLAAEALDSGGLPSRGLRAWTVPLLAAAAVLVALGLTAASQALRAERAPTPPAGSISTGPVSPAPTGGTSTASARSTPSASPTASASGTPARSAGAGNPAQNGGSRSAASSAPTDWFHGLDATTLPHTLGLCPAGLVDNVPGMGAPSVSVAGEPEPLWLVPVACAGATGDSSPRPVEVFRYSPAGPQLVQTLAYQAGDPRSIVVTSIKVGAGTVTLGESGYDTERDARSLRFTQTYTWYSGHFEAGPQQDAVRACADGQLMVTGAHDASQDGSAAGVLLTYTNTSDEPCALTGYPGASVLDAAGQPLAEAARTPSGPLGGLSAGDPPRVVLFGQITGSAVVEWATAAQGTGACYPMASVVITPPGMSVTSRFDNQPTVCGPQVHPVVYGGTGKQQAAG
ncbi:DUF4232 domain-containing protein [Jatrophihabitans sp.]|uniref:DUF4232 domain-containing protein n=1 Tax=Jatrophihabitans sp. TaxID=1932789 RepID=UPI002BFE7CCC|nr:DUF4232 domain-containing protein [Jatrophihabitans sp.]